MINKIGVDNTSKINSNNVRQKEQSKQNPNFKGVGAIVLAGIQACERMPMVNVTVIDMLSAILPRTVVESQTNWFAGFEAFRRESSGLVVNCLIPSLVTLGIAKCINPAIMPNGVNMSRCWADSSLIDKASDYYKNAGADDKVKESLKNILGNIQGYEGKNSVKFNEVLTPEEINELANKLAELSREKDVNKSLSEKISKWFRVTFKKEPKEVSKLSEIVKTIVEKTHVADNIKIADGKNVVNASSVYSLLSDSVKYFKEFQKSGIGIDEFAQKSRKLVRAKSLAGLAVILPLAASMQYINRWITGKVSGVKGAPIYDDFGKEKDNVEETAKAKKGLLKQKFISISSMVGVSLLSMMKRPTMNMLEFKGMFPTMDQARIISTTTFASRMAAADDKNELAESTVRDIATFSGLYFLGDYAAKAAATLAEKTTGISLLNDTKPLKGDENVAKKFWHWVKDVNIKSSEEVVSKTQQSLNGAKPTEAQARTIQKELKRACNIRSACHATSIGVSLALLGIIVPLYTRHKTKKKHAEALKLAQEKSQTTQIDKTQKEPVTPLNVKYNKLTAGFRADTKLAR